MKIVVGGYIVGYPLGGMTWHHLNYLLGLKSLGHDVTFLEDGAFLPPFNPIHNSKGDPTYGIEYLKKSFEQCDMNIPWHYRYGNFSAGLSIDETKSKLAEADLFIAVSGITPIEWYDLPKRSLVIEPAFRMVKGILP
ncbi:MAG TPA: hypothetical protein PK402_11410, partial [Tepidisphaeraceae bacterium]|nr:hypothetical protein [Tepidisphaeraceae bacterium]